MYVALCKILKADNTHQILLYCGKDGGVGSWKDEETALAYFRNGLRSAGGATAVEHLMYFQYSIVEAADEEDIRTRIATEPTNRVSCKHESGFIKGFETRPGAEALWESGVKLNTVPR